MLQHRSEQISYHVSYVSRGAGIRLKGDQKRANDTLVYRYCWHYGAVESNAVLLSYLPDGLGGVVAFHDGAVSCLSKVISLLGRI